MGCRIVKILCVFEHCAISRDGFAITRDCLDLQRFRSISRHFWGGLWGAKLLKYNVFSNIVPSLEMDLPSLEIVSISRDEFVISRDEVPFLEIDSISRDGCPISRIQFSHGFMS